MASEIDVDLPYIFEIISFERLLIAHCQKFFADRNIDELDDYELVIKKKRIIGNSLFIGELCNLDILESNLVINECILKTKIPNLFNRSCCNYFRVNTKISYPSGN